MLKLQKVNKTFNLGTVNEKKVLHIDLELNEGDFVTIIGGNGAGKSTLLNMISGLYPLDSGIITLDGEDISLQPEYQRAKKIGRLFQDPMLGTAADMQILENLALANRRGKKRSLAWGVTKDEKKKYYELVKSLNLGLEDRLTTKVGLLSGGQRQAITLLMATLQKPKLLLLDEHTAALDPATAEKVMEITKQIVAENNITTMMITHNLNQALTTGNRTIMMDSGEIILDIPYNERKNMNRDDLLQMYSMKKREALDNDRILFS